ncbi:MAG: dUTP diphosphatase [Treponema sp.]|nr:dUTP diphosphatase [Treponema sp.]
MDTLKVRVFKTGDAVRLPLYASERAAGADLSAFLAGDLSIAPGGRLKVPTGLVIEVPPGWEAQVRPRSGLALKYGVTVLNAPGTIDSDYRGELEVLLVNLGNETFTVHNGDRIAQLVFSPASMAEFFETDHPSETVRGSGGFGSTGVGS